MDHPPNRSAQEAALSAVNLAPVAGPSADSPTPEPSQGEALTISHGLLILERTPDGHPSWLACKFCPIFGCKTRKKTYIMMYMTPFNLGKIEGHLQKEHLEQWDRFKDLDQQQKKQFFHGKTLPAPAKFRARMEELKKSWGPKRMKTTKRKRNETSNDVAPSKRRKGLIGRAAQMGITQFFKRLTTQTPLSTHEDWIGRTSFETAVVQSLESEDDQPASKLVILRKTGIRRDEGFLPGKKVYQHLREILQRYSGPFSSDLLHVVSEPLVSRTELEKSVIIPPWNENSGKALLAARTVFYLLRGIPVDVAIKFFEEYRAEDEGRRVDKADKVTASKISHVDEPEKQEGTDVIKKQEDVKIEQVLDTDVSNQSKSEDVPLKDLHTSEMPQDWQKVVSDTANSVEIASMLAIKRILSKEESWAFVIITRPCPIRRGAVEILIPTSRTPNDVSISTLSGAARTRHATLDTVPTATQVASEAPTVIVNDANNNPPASKAKPNGTKVGNTTDATATEESKRDKNVSEIISLIFTEWLVLATTRVRLYDRTEGGMDEWVRGCVKMCLRHTLVFLNKSGGFHRAITRAREALGNATLYTDWIATASTDDAAIERTRANYYSWNNTMSDVEWDAEKQVIRGLARCFQNALALTSCPISMATIKYAKKILSRAIGDFDKAMPITRILPRLPLDPLHVVSVRKGNQAVENVISLLDLIYPQWPSRLIGIRSRIPDDAAGKGFEKELVKTFQERGMDDIKVVDESIPREERPIYPSSLAKMNTEGFRKFVDTYVKEPSNFESGFAEKLVLQHEVMRLKEEGNSEFRFCWEEYQGQGMEQLRTFVSGLKVLWEREPDSQEDACKFSGLVHDGDKGEIVDRDVEHVFRARTLMAIEQMEKLNQEDRRVQGRDASLTNCAIPWGKNWSNLLTTSPA